MANTTIPLARTSDLSGVAQETTLSGVATDVGTVKSDVATIKSDVTTVKTDVATVKSDVTTVKSDVTTVKTDVGTVKTDIVTIKTDIAALKTQAMTLGPVHFHSKKTVSGGVELKWKDPADTTKDGYPAAFWAKTTIVRKEGSAPTAIDDGTVVIVTTVRDQYQHTAYLDENGTASSYYKAFPQATSGYVNESADNIFHGYTLFGMTIDETNPDPDTCITYTDDCADFTPIRMDFENDVITGTADWMDTFIMPKPCMLHRADAEHPNASYVDYYLDPTDYTKKADGVTASDVADTSYDGNAMVEFNPIFLKVTKDAGKIHAAFCDIQLEEGFEAWSAKTHDGTYANWYQPIYEGSTVSGKMRSMSTGAKPANNTTATAEWANATSNNLENDQGWGATLWADEQVLMFLSWLVTRSLNIQTSIGGVYNTASSLQMNCGAGNSSGMFYGKNDGSYTTTKMFGMENRWGHRWRRAQGVNAIDYRIMVKMTLSSIDGATGGIVTSDNSVDYAHYINTEDIIPSASSAYISEINYGNYSAGLPLVATGGSSSTFYCDGMWSSGGLRGVRFGADVYNGLIAGVAALNANNAPSNSNWNIGASLSYLSEKMPLSFRSGKPGKSGAKSTGPAKGG